MWPKFEVEIKTIKNNYMAHANSNKINRNERPNLTKEKISTELKLQ